MSKSSRKKASADGMASDAAFPRYVVLQSATTLLNSPIRLFFSSARVSAFSHFHFVIA